jgi:CrcB protein
MNMNAIDVMYVGIGGGLGALLRWGVGLGISKRFKGDFPLGTFVINITGAFVIGFLSVFFKLHTQGQVEELLHVTILTGILGGYTTFSTMQLDTAKMVHRRQRFKGLVYMVVSVVCGVIAAVIGAWLGGLL